MQNSSIEPANNVQKDSISSVEFAHKSTLNAKHLILPSINAQNATQDMELSTSHVFWHQLPQPCPDVLKLSIMYASIAQKDFGKIPMELAIRLILTVKHSILTMDFVQLVTLDLWLSLDSVWFKMEQLILIVRPGTKKSVSIVLRDTTLTQAECVLRSILSAEYSTLSIWFALTATVDSI